MVPLLPPVAVSSPFGLPPKLSCLREVHGNSAPTDGARCFEVRPNPVSLRLLGLAPCPGRCTLPEPGRDRHGGREGRSDRGGAGLVIETVAVPLVLGVGVE